MKVLPNICSFIVILNISLIPCINAKESNITMVNFIRKEGYSTEQHDIQTEDGYILKTFRIPGKKGAPIVFLQHGFAMSSFDWIVLGKKKSLAFVLVDKGYDVWMGNARGNLYSRRHVTYDTSQNRFWNFSWHEMGVYDLPAVITYITQKSNATFTYVGHSMGATMFFVMAIEKPEIAKKVKAMYGLAPMAFAYHYQSPIAFLAPYADIIEDFTLFFDLNDLSRYSVLMKYLIEKICDENLSKENICMQLLFYLGGHHSDIPQEFVSIIFSHFPAGTSVKTAIHFLQIIRGGKFQYYDYRAAKNLQIYNSSVPPEYNLTKISVPIGVFSAPNDLFVSHEDAKLLYDIVPKKIMFHSVPNNNFNHFDFLWDTNAEELVYEKLLYALQDNN